MLFSSCFHVWIVVVCLATLCSLGFATTFNDFGPLKAALVDDSRLVTLIVNPDDCELGNYPVGKSSSISIPLTTWWLEDRPVEEDYAVIRHTDAFPWKSDEFWRFRNVVIHPTGEVELEETLLDRSAATANGNNLLELYRHKCAIGHGAIFQDGYPEDYQLLPVTTYEMLKSELQGGSWVTGQADVASCFSTSPVRALTTLGFDFSGYTINSTDGAISTIAADMPQFGAQVRLSFNANSGDLQASVTITRKDSKDSSSNRITCELPSGQFRLHTRTQRYEDERMTGDTAGPYYVGNNPSAWKSPSSAQPSTSRTPGFTRRQLDSWLSLHETWLEGGILEARDLTLRKCNPLIAGQEDVVPGTSVPELTFWKAYMSNEDFIGIATNDQTTRTSSQSVYFFVITNEGQDEVGTPNKTRIIVQQVEIAGQDGNFVMNTDLVKVSAVATPFQQYDCGSLESADTAGVKIFRKFWSSPTPQK